MNNYTKFYGYKKRCQARMDEGNKKSEHIDKKTPALDIIRLSDTEPPLSRFKVCNFADLEKFLKSKIEPSAENIKKAIMCNLVFGKGILSFSTNDGEIKIEHIPYLQGKVDENNMD